MLFGIDLDILGYGVAGSLIASAFVGTITYFRGRKSGKKEGVSEERKRFRANYEANISAFSDALGRLILEAASARDNRSLYASARAIVSTRDSMREQLSNIHRLLNSNIDTLSGSLGGRDGGKKFIKGQKEKGAADDGSPNPEEIRLIVETLAKTWPEKKVQIDAAYRSFLAEWGLTEIDDGTGPR